MKTETKKRKARPFRASSGLNLELIIIVSLVLKLSLGGGLILSLHRGVPVLVPQEALAADEPQADESESYDLKNLPPPKDITLTAKYQAMLLVLENRQKQLKLKEDMLKEKEEGLEALKEKIKEETDRLNELIRKKEAILAKEQEILEEQKKVLARQVEIEDARINHLVQAYSAMRPENAGKLVDSLEDEVAVRIFSSMSGRTAGKIMAFVDPAKAARLTKQLSVAEKKEPPPETEN